MNNPSSVDLTFQGFYQVAVVDAATGQEIWRQKDWSKNLILNQGMDALATYFPPEVFEYGIAGNGTRVNNLSAGESSGSAIGGWFYLTSLGSGIQDLNTTTYGGWNGILDVGDIIRFNDGTDVNVTNVSDFSASISESITVASQSFVIWKPSQTALQNELRRCGPVGAVLGAAYYTGTDPVLGTGCGHSTSSFHRLTNWRTYDFATESMVRSYTEVGVAWDVDDAPIPSTFSRMLLTAPVTVSIGQQLRVSYKLTTCFSPESASYVIGAPSGGGWPNVDLTQSFQALEGSNGTTLWYSYVTTAGSSGGETVSSVDIPAAGADCAFWASTGSQALIQLGVARPPARTGASFIATSSLDSYVQGTYRRSKYAKFLKHQMNYTTIASIGIGNNDSSTATSATGQVFTVLLNQTQSKYSTQELVLRFLWTWNRVLAS